MTEREAIVKLANLVAWLAQATVHSIGTNAANQIIKESIEIGTLMEGEPE